MPTRSVNWFAIVASVIVVGLLVVIGGIILWNDTGTGDSRATPSATPSATSDVQAPPGGILFGNGPDVLAVYLDFLFPFCNRFEQTYGETIDQLIDEGRITFIVFPVAILDSRSQGTAYSTRAGNAMFCVAERDPGRALSFLKALYVNQPPEGSPGLSDSQLLQVADSVGVTDVADCVGGRPYAGDVTANTNEIPVTPSTGKRGTPTAVLNGQVIDITFNVEKDLVDGLQ